MSHLYESKIKNMGNAGRNGGEYYTPRPLIKTIVKVVAPEIGNTIYDGAVGSAGFLCEAFEYLKDSKNLTTKQAVTLQKKTFYGKEKKSLAYIIGIMNMILHGIEAPNIVHTNTLAENISDIQEKDRFNIILANPPFGGKERKEVQQNFPIKTGETAFLFLQHFIKKLKAGGRAGVVIKNTFLSNTDNASISLRKQLLESCDLHTILDLPGGTFTGAGVKTVVLFFEKGASTKKVWFYQLNLDRNLGKTNPLNENDLAEFVELQKKKKDSDNSWTISVSELAEDTFDLSVKNPNNNDETVLREPKEILDEMKALDKENEAILKLFESYLNKVFANPGEDWEEKRLKEVITLEYGKPLDKTKRENTGLYPVYGANGEKARSNEYYYNKESIIVGRKGSAGEINITAEKFWPLDVTYFVTFDERKYNLKFLFHLLKTLNLPKLAKGVKPGINRNDVYSLDVLIPQLHEQNQIVKDIENLSTYIKSLESNYQQKFADLEELKKSILQKAFDGEL